MNENEKVVFDSLSKFITHYGKDSKKIAILISVLSIYEGAGRVAEDQAKELSKSGYDVTVFTFNIEKHNLTSFQNISIEKIFPKYYFLSDTKRMRKFWRAFLLVNIIDNMKFSRKLKGFDYIIVHQGNLMPFSWLAKILYRCKILYYNHHPFIPNKLMGSNRKVKLALGEIFNYFIAKADYIISVSLFSRRMLNERYGIDSYVIYNKTSIDNTKKYSGNRIRRKLEIGEEPIILYVGRIIPHKGVHLLIETFKLVLKSFPESKLLIIGREDDHTYLKEIREYCNDIKGSVIFNGTVSDCDLPYYYATCDVYATCSLWEGFNLPLLEAQKFSKPVVAFDIGPHREVVKNGFLVKEGNIEEFGRKLDLLITHQLKLRKDS